MQVENTLKKIRLKQKISQTSFAQRCGVSRQTIHAVEVEKYIPSVELALKISKELGLTVEKVFKLKGDK